MTLEERIEILEQRIADLQESFNEMEKHDNEFYDALDELANYSIDNVIDYYRGA